MDDKRKRRHLKLEHVQIFRTCGKLTMGVPSIQRNCQRSLKRYLERHEDLDMNSSAVKKHIQDDLHMTLGKELFLRMKEEESKLAKLKQRLLNVKPFGRLSRASPSPPSRSLSRSAR